MTGCLFALTEKRTLKTFWNQAEVNLSVTHLASKFQIQFQTKNLNSCNMILTVLYLLCITASLFLCMSCSDTDTVVGLPRPIHESIKTLKQVPLHNSLCFMGYFCLEFINKPFRRTLLIDHRLSCYLFSAQVHLHC